ncbi:hypothetical protein DFJ73DRAFT_880732 [Zopfochytrium polystomum]|nr:hypothetical protein DFJ73DRAFT_880732 [Zopfochytrium polystomum]
MTEPIHVYIVLYGSHEPAVAINIERFVDGLFASDLWGVTRTFYQPINGTNVPISGRIVLKDIWTDNYTVGRSLTVYSFGGVVLNAIYTHRSKPDPNGMYIVYAAPDVSVAGFCTQFCGARTSFFQLDVPDPVRMPFAVVGDASTCPRCVAPMWRNDSKTITGNIHADTPIPFISGLIPAIATDRFNDGWFDSLRRGISNKCGGLIPNLQYRDSVAYNLELDGNLFLVPALWDNLSQNCSIARKQHVRY